MDTTSGSETIIQVTDTSTTSNINADFHSFTIPSERHTDNLFVAAGQYGGKESVFILEIKGNGLLKLYFGPIIENATDSNWGTVKQTVLKSKRLALTGTNNSKMIWVYNVECDISCLTCFGPDSNNCISCNPNFILTSSNTCKINCDLAGYDYEESPNVCKNCTDINCDSCSRDNHCTSCDEGY